MRIKGKDKFSLLMTLLLIGTFIILAVFIITEEFVHITSVYENDLFNTANIIADDEIVIGKLKNEDNTMNAYIEKYYENVEELSLIIVLDMNNVRYTHPDNNLVGDECDQIEVSDVYNGVSYIGDYIDENGESSIRAFVPIYDEGIQIGVASTGVLKSNVNQLKVEKTLTILLGFGFGLIVSLIALTWLNKKFTNELFGFSPAEIALLYAENKSIIDQLSEAVVSIDDNYRITTLNQSALNMFGLPKDSIGKDVNEVFPHVDFKEIIEKNIHVTNKYRKINEAKLLMNAFPLYLDSEIIGATAMFRSHLEVDSLLDQISGYQQMSIALRSQKHEFQNKLHVVLGLIKMEDYEKAENYIRILALFVGKELQTRGFNAQLLLTSDSYLMKTHNPINSDDIVIVLGNLIDNSFEAYFNKDMEDKKIVVDLFEDEDKISMTVIDQAGGINPLVIDNMFERGISTKDGGSRGTGLSLVSEIVTVYNGEKNVYSTKEETKIEIILMKVNS